MPSSIHSRCFVRLAAALAFGLYASAASAQSTSAPKPPCRKSDPGVHLRGGLWSGPNCSTIDGAGRPVRPQPLAAAASEPPKPPCRRGDPGVKSTFRGWAGPNCTHADGFGRPLPPP